MTCSLHEWFEDINVAFDREGVYIDNIDISMINNNEYMLGSRAPVSKTPMIEGTIELRGNDMGKLDFIGDPFLKEEHGIVIRDITQDYDSHRPYGLGVTIRFTQQEPRWKWQEA